MNKPFGNADPRLEAYTRRVFLDSGQHGLGPEDAFLADVLARSAAAGLPDIQVAPLDALHLEVLVRMTGGTKAVEIGTLGGYSGMAILRGLGPAGILHTFEIDPRHAEVAAETFRRAGLSERAHIHVGPALGKLADIVADGPFDVVFIDADKVSYADYTEWAAHNLRVGGIAVLDNAFLFGRVVEEPTGEHAAAIHSMRRAHQILASSGRFRATMLPTGEGLALGVKIS